MSESYALSHDEPAPKRRRRRPALSCEQCRSRKMKCDRGDPCIQCVKAPNRKCTYSSHTPPADAFVTSAHQSGLVIAPRFLSDDQPSLRQKSVSSGIPSYPSPKALSTVPTWENFIGTTPRNETVDDEGERSAGTLSKTRLFGQSHWMHSFGRFNSIVTLRDNPIINSANFKDEWCKTEILAFIRRCKTVAKTEKKTLHDEWLRTPDINTLIPPREISDILTALYFSTGESLYRILHYPTFQSEYSQYWKDPSSASHTFILKMLLAMANGALFYQESDEDHIRSQAKKWIFAGQHWLSHMPSEKKRLCISGLQIHCLLILARQAHGIVGDLAWVSIGTLIRSGLNMGLHRDPKVFPKMSQMQGEIRKRLWASILEINVQLSLDMGLNPLMSGDDYDTGPPGNFDDADLDDSSRRVVFSKPRQQFTQSTIQIILWESLILRMRVCKLINDFRGGPSYEKVLELGGLLTKTCKEATSRSYPSQDQLSQPKITQLQRNLLDVSIRRFLFLLHGTYCVKALTDPRYYFSRKVCLDSAIIMSTYPSREDANPVKALDRHPRDQYTLLKIFSADFFKRVMIHSSMTIFHDLLQQIEDEADSPNAIKEQGKRAREPLKAILKEITDLVLVRLPSNVSNAKCHLFMEAIRGRLEAIEQGTSPEIGAMEGARKSARLCLGILDSMNAAVPKNGIPTPVQDMPTPAEDIPLGQLAVDEWNIDWEGSDSWLFTGWEEDKSW